VMVILLTTLFRAEGPAMQWARSRLNERNISLPEEVRSRIEAG